MYDAPRYEHKGYTITRTPVPLIVDEEERTGWAFDVRCPEGNPVDIVVEALDRSKGLRETRKAIERYIASTTAESALVAAQTN